MNGVVMLGVVLAVVTYVSETPPEVWALPAPEECRQFWHLARDQFELADKMAAIAGSWPLVERRREAQRLLDFWEAASSLTAAETPAEERLGWAIGLRHLAAEHVWAREILAIRR